MRHFGVICIIGAIVAVLSPGPVSVAGHILYGTDDLKNLYDVDTTTGLASNGRGDDPAGFAGIANSPTDILYGLTNTEFIYAINPADGAGAFVSLVNSPFGEGDIDFDPISGTMYAIGFAGNALYTVDPTDGSFTDIGDMIGLSDPSGMAFNDNGQLYVIDSVTDSLYEIDPANAAIISTTPLSSPLGEYVGMDFHPSTGMLFVADGGSNSTDLLYTLDTGSGNLSSVGTTKTGGLSGLEFVIPEPTTLMLAGIGFAGLIARRRRR